MFIRAKKVKSKVQNLETESQQLVEEAIDNAKLEWLMDKADRFGILIPNSLKNNPTKLETWLRHKAQQRGFDFDSDYKSVFYQWKELAEYMKNMGFVTDGGKPIIAGAKDYHW